MHYWRLAPREWRRHSADEQARMMAFMMFTQTREAYREEWKDDRRRRGNRDESDFAAMRRRMQT